MSCDERVRLVNAVLDIDIAIADLDADDRREAAERQQRIHALQQRAAYWAAVLEMFDDHVMSEVV